jgi:N-acyl-D-aspartate/D-glutamate deacylase
MLVRRATEQDVETMAEIIAAVAEEGSLGTEPPVDLQQRADRYRPSDRLVRRRGIRGRGDATDALSPA